MTACLLSNCSFTNLTSSDSLAANATMSCAVIVYYVPRCTDQAPTSGLYNTEYSSGNSACRKLRFNHINEALRATPKFTNVPSFTINETTTAPVSWIQGETFSNTTRKLK